MDYRNLNAVTKKDAYLLPRIDETLDALANASMFATLDLQSGFWQIPVRDAYKEKTAFQLTMGTMLSKQCNFDLQTACYIPETDGLVLSGLHWMHCLAYLDDNIVPGSSIEEHIQSLDTVLERIASEGFM